MGCVNNEMFNKVKQKPTIHYIYIKQSRLLLLFILLLLLLIRVIPEVQMLPDPLCMYNCQQLYPVQSWHSYVRRGTVYSR